MTRSVTIVNTSNWEHEDVEVVEVPESGSAESTMLKPGDKMTCGPWGPGQRVTLVLKPVETRPEQARRARTEA